jgi:hypothetical protein
MARTQIQATAESWADLSKFPRESKEWECTYNAFLMGWSCASASAVQLLKRQYEGCQPGTLVSYAIAADVLKLDLKEYETKPA